MAKKHRVWCLSLLMFFTPFGGKATPPDSLNVLPVNGTFNKDRFYLVAGSQLVGLTGTLTALSYAWYGGFPKASFHFHNDMPDWFQQDKLGHLVSAYHMSRISSGLFYWAGCNNSKGAWLGAIASTGFLTAVEILDGFSELWGASLPDAAANTLGTALFLTQQLAWEEQRVILKYSYSESGLAKYRPSLLGGNLPEKMLKDYNAQTFWLSFNLLSLLPGSRMPQWLNIAVGHGAYGLLGSRTNPAYYNEIALPQMERYRRWFLAPDIDFSRIPTQNPWLKAIFNGLNIVKMPVPAIEYNRLHGFSLHWVFF